MAMDKQIFEVIIIGACVFAPTFIFLFLCFFGGYILNKLKIRKRKQLLNNLDTSKVRKEVKLIGKMIDEREIIYTPGKTHFSLDNWNLTIYLRFQNGIEVRVKKHSCSTNLRFELTENLKIENFLVKTEVEINSSLAYTKSYFPLTEIEEVYLAKKVYDFVKKIKEKEENRISSIFNCQATS